jgi:hypothetical protein
MHVSGVCFCRFVGSSFWLLEKHSEQPYTEQLHTLYTWWWSVRPKHVVWTLLYQRGCTKTARSGEHKVKVRNLLRWVQSLELTWRTTEQVSYCMWRPKQTQSETLSVFNHNETSQNVQNMHPFNSALSCMCTRRRICLYSHRHGVSTAPLANLRAVVELPVRRGRAGRRGIQPAGARNWYPSSSSRCPHIFVRTAQSRVWNRNWG